MFTASHNPAAVQRHQAVPGRRAARSAQDTGLAEIKAMVAGGLLERAEDPGRVERRDLLPAFVAHVHSFVDLDALAPLRVVADTANGVGGLDRARGVRRPAVRARPSSSASSTARSRTTRPTRSTVENLEDLQRAVLDSDADVGLAFDGDADRVVLVDDQAQPVSGSTTTAILAAAILRPAPGRDRSCTT